VPTNAFRADQIGSLLRPEPLLEARDRFLDGQLDAKRLEEMEDAAILQALAKQKGCNIDVYVDGEFRRTGFMTNFTDSVHGFESAVASAQSWRGDKGNRPSPNIRIVKDKAAVQEPDVRERRNVLKKARAWAFQDHTAEPQ